MSHFSIETESVFVLGGGRELVNESRAIELLAELTHQDATILRLCNKSFSPEAAAVIIERVKNFPSLKIADVSDVIAGRPEEEALRTLLTITEGLQDFPLVEINISDNALGLKGIDAFRGILVGKLIEVLIII